MVIAVVFSVMGRDRRFTGFFIGALIIAYAPFRFGLDFLRIVDARYAGLTPAQYGSLALLASGVLILARRLQVFRSDPLQL